MNASRFYHLNALHIICAARRLGTVVIDSGFYDLTYEFHVLLRLCAPSVVALLNTNIPGHSGWIKEWLLAEGSWHEVRAASGRTAHGELDGTPITSISGPWSKSPPEYVFHYASW